MQTSLRLFRYFIFGLFLACTTVTAIVAVWNFNLLQDALVPSSSLSFRTDIYLLVAGCAGIALIFPILFCEIAQKNVFLVRVWFECIWVALFSLMFLAGAACASAAGSAELCGIFPSNSITINGSAAMCNSNKVLQAFSWICGLFLLFYFASLFMATLLGLKDDGTIWQCNSGQFPWTGARRKLSHSSPAEINGEAAPKRRSKVSSIGAAIKRLSKGPSIVAPKPRNAASEATRRAILSYRSGLSGEYAIEHFNPEGAEALEERPLPPAPLVLAPETPSMSTRQATAATFGHSLYPQHIQSVLPSSSVVQAPMHSPPRQPPSPSPIGNWPRMNPPTPRPKRKTQNASITHAELNRDAALLPPLTIALPSASVPPRSDFKFPSPASAPSIPPNSFSSRPRPSGPRRPSLDGKSSLYYSGYQVSSRNPS